MPRLDRCRIGQLPILLLTVLTGPVAAQTPEETAGFAGKVQPFLVTYCIDCHGPFVSKGDTTLHDLTGQFRSDDELALWDRVLEKLERGEMPPPDADQPDQQTRTAVRTNIRSSLKQAITQHAAVSTAPSVRRLTNFEYQNTLRDLLGFELEVIDDLPEDPERFYRFNNTAELMRIGPEQLTRYLEVARRAMRSVIVDPEKPDVYRARREWQPFGNDKGLGYDEIGVWGNRRNSAADGLGLKNVPKTGEFRIRMRASAILPTGYREVPLNLDMGTPPGRTETPYRTVATVYLSNSPDDPQTFEFTGRIENHPFVRTRVGKSDEFVDQMTIRPRIIFDDGTLNDGGTYAKWRQTVLPRAVIHSLEFEVPIVDVWPPRHHTAILFESPLRETDENAYIAEVLKRFLTRAYRRPALDTEVEKFQTIFRLLRSGTESFEEAVRETLAMVLVSPQFLYHTETDPATGDQFAMASRLSYFLWGSMPDDELFRLAEAERLSDPDVIEQQARRMLADERSREFVQDFTLQWLSIRKMLTVPVNPQLYPRFLYRVPNGETAGTEMPYRPTVRDHMLQETVGFIAELINRNESVLAIVDSDFAMLNARLAAHYGIDGVRGMRLRPVPITPQQHLGGLLTHGSVLIGNGTGTAPHPIYRAVWLREAILGEEVAPPPSEVPALTDTAGESLDDALSIADLLAKHRTVESCNDCHVRLDPWGIPFEEYNAIGRFQPRVPKDGTRIRGVDAKRNENLNAYRNYLASQNVVEVEAKARVPLGPEIDGVRELKAYLLEHRSEDIAENVTRRLLAYGLGRNLTYRDRFVVEELLERAEPQGYRFRDLIISICQSNAFQPRLARTPE